MRVVIGGVGYGAVVPVGVDVVVRLRRASVILAAALASAVAGPALATLSWEYHWFRADNRDVALHGTQLLIFLLGVAPPLAVAVFAQHNHRAFAAHNEGNRRLSFARGCWLPSVPYSALMMWGAWAIWMGA